MKNFTSNYKEGVVSAANNKVIDKDPKNIYNVRNITVTLSALWVTRNLGGFSLPKIYSPLPDGVNKCL